MKYRNEFGDLLRLWGIFEKEEHYIIALEK